MLLRLSQVAGAVESEAMKGAPEVENRKHGELADDQRTPRRALVGGDVDGHAGASAMLDFCSAIRQIEAIGGRI